MSEQSNDNDGVSKELLLSEDDASKVSAGATTGGSVNIDRHTRFKERA